MDLSGASYADDQLGNVGDSDALFECQFERIARASGPRRQISHLLGGIYGYGAEGATGSIDYAGILSSFGDSQVSAGTAEGDEYLKSLVTDNEIEQIRSESQNLLDWLLSVFVFEDASRIRSFLEDHPSVPEALSEARPFLMKSFGESAVLQLQIPPDEDAPLTIYAVAQWDGPLEDARAALKTFDQLWWAANSQKASGRIVFDYQLV